jgi:hypothetical protein
MKVRKNLMLLMLALCCSTVVMAQVNGDEMKYGDHTYTIDGKIKKDIVGGIGSAILGGGKKLNRPTAKVTFTNVPSSYEEFEAVYTQFLGKTIHGTAAMIPMAIEMYARDAAVGRQCFELICNGPATVSGIIRILKEKLPPNADYSDSYTQRYMAAALLKGATAKNAYTPDYPYTVQMCRSANDPQESSYGTVTYLYILAKGWDTEQRQVEILKPDDGGLYKVFNCPSCYTQCKNIKGTWKGLK